MWQLYTFFSSFLSSSGQCWMRLGDYEKAAECLRKAIQLHRNERSFTALAQIYQMSGDLKGLIEMYSAALE